MSVEWFDLGQRYRAACTGQPQPRLLHAPVGAVPNPVAIRAVRTGEHVTVTAASAASPAQTARGPAALDLLASLGVTLASPTPATVVTDHPGTLSALHRLARATSPGAVHDDVAAHIAWWHDRADYPGGRAVVDILGACRARWVTGHAPAAEQHPATWRRWLDLPDEFTSGLLHLHARLTDAPPLPWLDALAEDDVWAYAAAQRAHSDGWDWRRPDTTSRAALGLRSRCDAADLYAAALLTDPLYRARAVHTGHVVTGTAHWFGDKLKRCEVTCTRLDARLRPGTEVTGWVGTPTTSTPTFSTTITAATVSHGRLVLTLTRLTGPGPVTGQPVTLAPTAPNPHRQRCGRKSYRALYAARRSWLTTGRTPTVTRRPVPLDVLVAGAEPD